MLRSRFFFPFLLFLLVAMGFLYYLGSVVWNFLIAYTIIASIFAFLLAALGIPPPHFLAVIPDFFSAVNSAIHQLSSSGTLPVAVFAGLRLFGLFVLNSFAVFVAGLGGFLYDLAVTLGAPQPIPSLMFLVGAILQGAFVVWRILTWLGWRPT